MTTKQQTKKSPGIWQERGAGHVAEFQVGWGGALFSVYKATPWTHEQIAKALSARENTFNMSTCPVRFMPELDSRVVMITYADWINPNLNLRLVWLDQVIRCLMVYGEVNHSIIGNWSIPGVEIKYCD